MIALDDVVLRDDLDPRLGDRDDDLITQYADIFDALPPIEINQHNEVIDGWHRVRAAERAKQTEIAYVVVETEDDDDLGDRMWTANVKHGVQYNQKQKRAFADRLKKRGLANPKIAEIVAVSDRTVRRWYPKTMSPAKEEAQKLRDEGKSLRGIAEELDVPKSTVDYWLSEIGQMAVSDSQQEPLEESEPAPETGEAPIEAEAEKPQPAAELELYTDEATDQEEAAILEPEAETSEDRDPEPDTGEAPTDEQPDIPQPELAEEEPATPEPELEPPPPEPIPENILETSRAVMGAFVETRPDDYVARLAASDSEWMTITDDSLSNELERELLTSAAAMCLWQELMIWYQGKNAGTFTDAFGKIGPVFVRGQTGQWSIVSRLRSILRRLRT